MNFALTAEQEMLRDTARELLANAGSLSIAQVRALNRTGPRTDGNGAVHFSLAADLDDSALWTQLAQLGFLGLPFSAEHGGSDGSFMDLAVLLEELGRAVGPPAFTQTIALSGLCIERHGSAELRRRWIPHVVAGQARLALALTEAEDRDAADAVALRARRTSDDYVLDGTKRHVEEGGRSDALVVAARDDAGRVVLLIVEAHAPGISMRPHRSVSGGDRVEIRFDDVRVAVDQRIGAEGTGEAILDDVLQRGAVAACLDMVGGAAAVLDMAVAYAAEREQFGRKIGSFQAVQHHASNMAVDVDASRLITYQAAWKLSEGVDARTETAMAKAWTGDAYRRVCTLGHQIFGGIGLMREHDMHLFLRRSRRDDIAFGDAAVHLDALAELLDAVETPWPELRGFCAGSG